MYIGAKDSEVLADFEDMGLIDLIVKEGSKAFEHFPPSVTNDEDAMAETIENNIRKVIIDEQSVNPKYYEKMSELLDALIEERRKQAIDYKAYLEKVKELSVQVEPWRHQPEPFPAAIDTPGKKALYQNFVQDEEWVLKVDHAIRSTKKADWIETFRKMAKCPRRSTTPGEPMKASS